MRLNTATPTLLGASVAAVAALRQQQLDVHRNTGHRGPHARHTATAAAAAAATADAEAPPPAAIAAAGSKLRP